MSIEVFRSACIIDLPAPYPSKAGYDTNTVTARHRILPQTLLAATVALGVVYLADYLALRHRLARDGLGAATATVTILYGTPLKNGQVRIFWDQPQTETCVRSIFPHLDYPPCWYAKLHTTKMISETLAPLCPNPGRRRSDTSHTMA